MAVAVAAAVERRNGNGNGSGRTRSGVWLLLLRLTMALVVSMLLTQCCVLYIGTGSCSDTEIDICMALTHPNHPSARRRRHDQRCLIH